jgi:hypothetical protein
MQLAVSDLRFGPNVDIRKTGLGGFGVWINGEHAGWIFESGDKWNAYRPNKGGPGTPLGKYPLADAVRKILREAGWAGPSS